MYLGTIKRMVMKKFNAGATFTMEGVDGDLWSELYSPLVADDKKTEDPGIVDCHVDVMCFYCGDEISVSLTADTEGADKIKDNPSISVELSKSEAYDLASFLMAFAKK